MYNIHTAAVSSIVDFNLVNEILLCQINHPVHVGMNRFVIGRGMGYSGHVSVNCVVRGLVPVSV